MFRYLFIAAYLAISSCGTLLSQDTLTRKETRKQKANYLLEDRHWTIEIPLWIPGFAGNFAYGDIEIEGEDNFYPVSPIEPPDRDFGKIFKRLFSDEWFLKFFFITRMAYENNRFLAQLDALAGSVGESVKFVYNDASFVDASYATINFRLFAGYKFVNADSKNGKFRYELFGYLGSRTHIQKIYSELAGLETNLDIRPAWIEPIIGIQNQLTWKRWFVTINGDYGGYFVGSKHSFQFSGTVFFRCGKSTSVKLGWNHLDLNHKGTFLNENYKIKATFSGPTVGVAFQF